MKKLMFATLSLVCMFVIAGGRAAPSAAAAPVAPQIGSCRWFCGSSPTQFKTVEACEAVCATECEAVC